MIEFDGPQEGAKTKPRLEEMKLETLKRGAVAEQFNEALDRVLENVVDPNTEAEAVRSVTLKVSLKPDEDRETIAIKANVTAKLASAEAITGKAFIVHTRDGVKAAEHDPAQQNFIHDEEVPDPAKLEIVEGGAG